MTSLPPLRHDSAFSARGKRDRKKLEELRNSWGQPIARVRAMDTIAQFHRLTGGAMSIDDATWGDLGMDEVFAAVDRTVGMPGRQILYHQMRSLDADGAQLKERSRQQAFFRSDVTLRERLQLLLGRLDRSETSYSVPLLFGATPAIPEAAWVFYLLSFAAPVCGVGMFFLHALFLPFLTSLVANLIIHVTYGQKILPHFHGIAEINTILGTADSLRKISSEPPLPQLVRLKQHAPVISAIRRRLRWIVVDRAALSPIAQAVFEYLNMFFLFDVMVFLRSVGILKKHQVTLAEIYESIGSLDAAIAVASYSEGLANVVIPELTTSPRMEVLGLYHPLIPGVVGSDFMMNQKGALIAGPNMAGKTAFIRTIGINLIFARTLHLCLAQKAVLPWAVVKSAIRREDALSNGESYFFSEIKQILDFTKLGPNEPLHVFLIDEIFRGTNTTERIASSTAVLRHLARHHLVFATTHDSELQHLLSDVFSMYHFSDCVVDNQYGFDYQIRSGPVRSRNAIKLLEISGYPRSIVEEADRLVASMERGPS